MNIITIFIILRCHVIILLSFIWYTTGDTVISYLNESLLDLTIDVALF